MGGKLNTIAIEKKDGTIDIVDIKTGDIVSDNGVIDDVGEIVPIQDEDGKLIHIQKGLRLEDVFKRGPKFKYKYSPYLADIICQRIAEGAAITRLCKEEGIPSYCVLSMWRTEHPEFEEKLERARRDRAEFYADKAVHEATKEGITKDEVPAQRLKHEGYKWGAGVDNPERYQNRTKLVGDPNAPVSFIIETGVRRLGDVGCGIKEVTNGQEEETTKALEETKTKEQTEETKTQQEKKEIEDAGSYESRESKEGIKKGSQGEDRKNTESSTEKNKTTQEKG